MSNPYPNPPAPGSLVSDLANVKFVNNLGSLEFNNCILGITDNWEYDGRVARHVKSISVDGHLQRGDPNGDLSGLVTTRGAVGKNIGDLGVLTLPWTTLQRIRITDLDIPTNQWLDWIPVQAVFSDDYPDTNLYTWSFYGITLYNPKLSFSLPQKELRDEYMQMKFSGPVFLLLDPRNGVFRQRAAEKNMELTLTASVRVKDGKLPTNFLPTLTQRNGFTDVRTQPFVYSIPSGWPRAFSLGDAIPEIKKDMNLAQCMVTGAQGTWQVEEQVIQVTISMICPPQFISI